jgi:hypothetical protein
VRTVTQQKIATVVSELDAQHRQLFLIRKIGRGS